MSRKLFDKCLPCMFPLNWFAPAAPMPATKVAQFHLALSLACFVNNVFPTNTITLLIVLSKFKIKLKTSIVKWKKKRTIITYSSRLDMCSNVLRVNGTFCYIVAAHAPAPPHYARFAKKNGSLLHYYHRQRIGLPASLLFLLFSINSSKYTSATSCTCK